MKDIQDSDINLKNILTDTYINILQEYIEGHFLREQYALMSIDYKELTEHIEAHDDFSIKVREVIEDYRNGKIDAISELGQFVTKWMLHHIKTMDSKYIGLLTNDSTDSRPLAFLLKEEIIFVD